MSTMAFSPLSFSMLVIIATMFLPSIAMAKEFLVGDDHGWTVGLDYNAWATDKTFLFGNKVVFKYSVGEHNVIKVNGTSYQSCTVTPASEALSTGSDTILLATPGRKWYMRGVVGHCKVGQKLVIKSTSPDTGSRSSTVTCNFTSSACASFWRWVHKRLLTIFH